MTGFLRSLISLLQWCRIADENGCLSLTHLFVGLAAVVYYLHPDAVTAGTAAAAVANYAVCKKGLPLLSTYLAANKADAQLARKHAADQAAADRDHATGLATISADAENLAKHVQTLSEQVQKLATPERLEAVKRLSGQTLNPAPRMPTRL